MENPLQSSSANAGAWYPAPSFLACVDSEALPCTWSQGEKLPLVLPISGIVPGQVWLPRGRVRKVVWTISSRTSLHACSEACRGIAVGSCDVLGCFASADISAGGGIPVCACINHPIPLMSCRGLSESMLKALQVEAQRVTLAEHLLRQLYAEQTPRSKPRNAMQ